MNKLNDDILNEIFKNIPYIELINLKLVNKKWYILIEDFFRHITNVSIYIRDDYRYLEHCLCYSHYSNQINSFKYSIKFSNLLNNIFNFTIKLRSLNLYFLEFNQKCFTEFNNQQFLGTTLEHLNISFCIFEKLDSIVCNELWKTFFLNVGKCLKHFIFYANSMHMMDLKNLLFKLQKYCFNLDTLMIDLNQDINSPYKPNIHKLHSLNKCKIKHLHLHCDIYNTFNTSFSNLFNFNLMESITLKCIDLKAKVLIQTLSKFENVQTLKFSMVNLEEDQFSLAKIVGSMKYLKELHLLSTNKYTCIDIFLDTYSSYGAELKVLIICNYTFSENILKKICECMFNLEVLHLNALSKCVYVTHNSIINYKNIFFNEYFYNLSKLKSLGLNFSDIQDKQVLDLIMFFKGKLTTISLIECPLITKETLNNIREIALINTKLNYKLYISDNYISNIDEIYYPSNLMIECRSPNFN